MTTFTTPLALFLTLATGSPDPAPTALGVTQEVTHEDPTVLSLAGDRVHVAATGSASLADLVDGYASLEGLRFSIDDDAEARLRAIPLDLAGGSTDLARDQITPFVEALLRSRDFVLEASGARGLLTVRPLRGARGTKIYVNVDSDDLFEMRRHPALMMQTLVTLEHTDVRQLATNLRPMFMDPGYQSILSMGTSNSLYLGGTGTELAQVIELLREMERAAAPRDLPAPGGPGIAGASSNVASGEDLGVEVTVRVAGAVERPTLGLEVFEVREGQAHLVDLVRLLALDRHTKEQQFRVWYQDPSGGRAPWPAPQVLLADGEGPTTRMVVQAAAEDLEWICATLGQLVGIEQEG